MIMENRTDHRTHCWIQWANLTVSYSSQVILVSLFSILYQKQLVVAIAFIWCMKQENWVIVRHPTIRSNHSINSLKTHCFDNSLQSTVLKMASANEFVQSLSI